MIGWTLCRIPMTPWSRSQPWSCSSKGSMELYFNHDHGGWVSPWFAYCGDNTATFPSYQIFREVILGCTGLFYGEWSSFMTKEASLEANICFYKSPQYQPRNLLFHLLGADNYWGDSFLLSASEQHFCHCTWCATACIVCTAHVPFV